MNNEYPEYTYCVPQREQKGVRIHIPKTGGTCAGHYLKQVAPHMVLAHASANFLKMKLNGRFDNFYDKIFTFGFVRNPWERAVSLYLFYKRHKARLNGFDDFVLSKTPIFFVEYSVDLLLRDTLSQKWHLVDHKTEEIIVDYIGKIENFNQDFDYIRNQLGLEPLGEYEIINKQFQGVDNNDYRTWYNDVTINAIRKRCVWEIDKFGYEFDKEEN